MTFSMERTALALGLCCKTLSGRGSSWKKDEHSDHRGCGMTHPVSEGTCRDSSFLPDGSYLWKGLPTGRRGGPGPSATGPHAAHVPHSPKNRRRTKHRETQLWPAGGQSQQQVDRHPASGASIWSQDAEGRAPASPGSSAGMTLTAQVQVDKALAGTTAAPPRGLQVPQELCSKQTGTTQGAHDGGGRHRQGVHGPPPDSHAHGCHPRGRVQVDGAEPQPLRGAEHRPQTLGSEQ